jgi:hypothetical protein
MRFVFDCTGITMNPYHNFASSFAQLVAAGKSLPLGGIPPHHKPKPLPNVPAAIIFSPHPDDECIAGGQGGAAPDFTFVTRYRLRRWKNGRVENVCQGGKQISATENPGSRLDLIR